MTTATAAVYNNCIGKVAQICQNNDLIFKKMNDCDEFPRDQVALAAKVADKSGRVLNRLILNYLMRL